MPCNAAVKLGICLIASALIEFLQATNDLSPSGKVDAAHHLATGERLWKEAERKQVEGQYAEAVKLAAETHREWEQGYLAAQPSKAVEGRAFWNHSGTGAYPGDWDRTAQELSKAGFNMILPNMLWGGQAHYASDVLPRSRTFEKYGDQIEQCVAAARKYGLQVHVWKVNWNLSGAPQEFVAKIHRENRNQVSVDGKAHDWLCPSHPDNFQLELDSMLEVARKYDVDGLHFDYIRYPDRDKCYCDGCRERFETDLGRKVANWPQDCYAGPLREDYATWRCHQITRLVKAVHDQAKQLRPGHQNFGGGVWCLSELPRVGGSGLARLDPRWAAGFRLSHGLHAGRSGVRRSGDQSTATGRRAYSLVPGHWPVALDGGSDGRPDISGSAIGGTRIYPLRPEP